MTADDVMRTLRHADRGLVGESMSSLDERVQPHQFDGRLGRSEAFIRGLGRVHVTEVEQRA